MDLNHQSLLKEISQIPYFQDKPLVTLDDLSESHRPKGRCFCVISHTIFF